MIHLVYKLTAAVFFASNSGELRKKEDIIKIDKTKDSAIKKIIFLFFIT